jgi:hypothetical protein
MSSSVSRLILLYASVVGFVTIRASEVVCIFSPSLNLDIHFQTCKLPDITLDLIGLRMCSTLWKNVSFRKGNQQQFYHQ